MRFYIYLMLVTFDMKMRKIFKNALIFTVLGIKRNLMALLGMILLLAISIALIFLLVPLKIYAVILLPFLCILGFSGFMYTYAAYPVIERYMIAPVTSTTSADPSAEESDSSDEPSSESAE